MTDWAPRADVAAFAAPEACTLPTSEHPLRVSEFADLLAVVSKSCRPENTSLDLVLPYGVEAAARDLARRESLCCSFFAFEFERTDEAVVMRIGVPPEQVEVLDAIQARIGRPSTPEKT